MIIDTDDVLLKKGVGKYVEIAVPTFYQIIEDGSKEIEAPYKVVDVFILGGDWMVKLEVPPVDPNPPMRKYMRTSERYIKDILEAYLSKYFEIGPCSVSLLIERSDRWFMYLRTS